MTSSQPKNLKTCERRIVPRLTKTSELLLAQNTISMQKNEQMKTILVRRKDNKKGERLALKESYNARHAIDGERKREQEQSKKLSI